MDDDKSPISLIFDKLSESTIKSQRREYSQLVLKMRKPPADQIFVKGSTVTYNHFYEFALGPDDYLWIRKRRNSKVIVAAGKQGSIGFNWIALELPFDPIDAKCKEISVDDEYLLLIDTSNRAYLRQVIGGLRESYSDPRKGKYTCASMIDTMSWERKWFQLPVLEHIGELIYGEGLYLPKGHVSSAVSSRGSYTYFTEDHLNRKIPDRAAGSTPPSSTITLYVLEPGGTRIRLYDPWSPTYSRTYLWMPESYNTYFQAVGMSAAGGTLAIIGYEHDHRTGIKQLKVYTQLADLDTLGWNPMFNFSHTYDSSDDCGDSDNLFKLLRVLPFDRDWHVHPLPEDAEVSADISISLTRSSWDCTRPAPSHLPSFSGLPVTQVDGMYANGGGRRARELRVPGMKGEIRGYYRKMISDNQWTFIRNDKLALSSEVLVLLLNSSVYTTKVKKPRSPTYYLPCLPDMYCIPPTHIVDLICNFETGRVRDNQRNNTVCLREFGFHRRFFKVYFYPYGESDLEYPNREVTIYVRQNVTAFLPDEILKIVDAILPDKLSEEIKLNETLVIDNDNLESDVRLALGLGHKQIDSPIAIDVDMTVIDGKLTIESKNYKNKFKITSVDMCDK